MKLVKLVLHEALADILSRIPGILNLDIEVVLRRSRENAGRENSSSQTRGLE
jgi:type III secretory pathway lipoprotein EscJ